MTQQYKLWGMPPAISSNFLWFSVSPSQTNVCRLQKAQKEATAVKEQAASGSHEAPDPPLYRSDDFRMYCMKVSCSAVSAEYGFSLVDAASAAAPRPCLSPCLCCHAAPWAFTKAARSRRISEPGPCAKMVCFSLLQVLPCSKRYCHDWTTCPFSHPGEKARRRDPRTQPHTGIACPDMKKARSPAAGRLLQTAAPWHTTSMLQLRSVGQEVTPAPECVVNFSIQQ